MREREVGEAPLNVAEIPIDFKSWRLFGLVGVAGWLRSLDRPHRDGDGRRVVWIVIRLRGRHRNEKRA